MRERAHLVVDSTCRRLLSADELDDLVKNAGEILAQVELSEKAPKVSDSDRNALRSSEGKLGVNLNLRFEIELTHHVE